MAINITDFDKIWASTSPLTPYAFSDSNYKQGWNFVGATPPARQMWDFLQKQNDEKTQWLYNNKLSLSGGTMTGALNTTNNTWNNLGDDAAFGGHNVAGKMCVKTQTTAATGIAFFDSSDTNVGQMEVNNAFNFNKTVNVSGKTAEVINTLGSNYIRYESGLQICWFNENVTDTDKTVTFPSAFASAPRVTASIGARTQLRVVSVTATNFIAQTSNSSNTNCQFIAVGKWK